MSDIERKPPVDDTNVDASISVLGDGSGESKIGARSARDEESAVERSGGAPMESLEGDGSAPPEGVSEDWESSASDEERILKEATNDLD